MMTIKKSFKNIFSFKKSKKLSTKKLPTKKLVNKNVAAIEKFNIDIPLVLDLDDCLLKTDFLYESCFAYLKQNPFRIVKVINWLMLGGKPKLKQELENSITYDVNLYPENEELVELAKHEAKRGRKIHLATASCKEFAKKVAKRFEFISDVHTSNENFNLKADNKAKVLEKNYPNGFIYAGDSAADIAVWKKAKGIILVEAKSSTIAKIIKHQQPDIIIEKQVSYFKTIIKAIRLHQWAKNILVFVPLFLSGAFVDLNNWLLAFIGFLSLSLLASATYLINDLWDLPDDRAHWSKRTRALASGNLSIPKGIFLAFYLLFLALILALILPAMAQVLLVIYLLTTLTYSFFLKKQPIIDVATIAILFLLRVAFGAYVIAVEQSSWLLVFAMALFLSLSFAKRVVEVQKLNKHDKTITSGRGYRAEDKSILMIFGAASGLSSVIVMVMYIFNDAFNAQFYSAPILLWAFPVVLLIWVCHIWLTCSRGELNDDPVIFALKDRKSLALASLLPIVFVLSWAAKPWIGMLGL